MGVAVGGGFGRGGRGGDDSAIDIAGEGMLFLFTADADDADDAEVAAEDAAEVDADNREEDEDEDDDDSDGEIDDKDAFFAMVPPTSTSTPAPPFLIPLLDSVLIISLTQMPPPVS
jgi:hypothetical protein